MAEAITASWRVYLHHTPLVDKGKNETETQFLFLFILNGFFIY